MARHCDNTQQSTQHVVSVCPSNAHLGSADWVTLTDLNNVLEGGKRKPGRPVGSGRGVKRKAPDEYSSNKNTIKVLKRRAGLTPAEAQLERATRNDQSAVSRAVARMRQHHPGWNELAADEQQKLKNEVTARVLDKRKATGYASKAVTLLQMTIERDRLATSVDHAIEGETDAGSAADVVQEDEKDDNFDTAELIWNKTKHPIREEVFPEQVEMADEECDELVRVGVLERAKRSVLAVRQQTMWDLFRYDVAKKTARLDKKLKLLRSILPVYNVEIDWRGAHPNLKQLVRPDAEWVDEADPYITDIWSPKVLRALRRFHRNEEIRAWDVLTFLPWKLSAYNGPGLYRLESFKQSQAAKWAAGLQAFGPYAHDFFDQNDRSIIKLRVAQARRHGWISDERVVPLLPGPSHWWPTDVELRGQYGVAHGFFGSPAESAGLIRAAEALRETLPPLGWEEAMLDEQRQSDIIWRS